MSGPIAYEERVSRQSCRDLAFVLYDEVVNIGALTFVDQVLSRAGEQLMNVSLDEYRVRRRYRF